MSRRSSQRWAVAGGFAVAAAYAVVALVVLILSKDSAVAIPFAYIAVSIAAPLALVVRFLDPPHRDDPGGGGPSDDNSQGPSGDGDDHPTAPPWWPEFEREFWDDVNTRRPDAPLRDRGDRVPVP